MPEKTLAVVGLGYVGLPVAVLASRKGWQVFGVDIDATKVDLINQGKVPFEDKRLAEELPKYPIEATTDPSVISQTKVIIIAVPTPVTEEKLPDLKPLTSAVSSIVPHLRGGQLLSVESTINPGVMDRVIMPLLKERADLTADDTGNFPEALAVVHCPERINPGDTKWTIETIPRVIGGYSKAGTQFGQEFYESILSAPVKIMRSVTEAEAVKIFENTFRDINIAFVNEMAKSFDKLGIDVKDVIEGAATKPFAFMAHYPGTGVGGHCISVDPYYMIERAKEVGFEHKFLQLARQINDSMPAYTVELMEHGLHKLGIATKNATVALLGLAYKRDIDDIRESPSLKVRSILEERVNTVRVYDPFVPRLSSASSLEKAVRSVDAVILATDHTEFKEALTPKMLAQHGIKLVVDGKNVLDADGIKKAGIVYYGIGRSTL